MGRVRNSQGSAHRPGPLKQANKRHKTGGHRTKRGVDLESRGRVNSVGSIGKIAKRNIGRTARRKQKEAVREQKIQLVMDRKKNMGGMRGAPIAVAIVPLSSVTDLPFTIKYLIDNSTGNATVTGQVGNSTHLKLNNGKNLMLVTPQRNDLWSVLDTLKLCDVSVFVLPLLEPISPEGLTLLKAAKEQGFNTPFVAVGSTFSKSEEKAFLKSTAKFLPVDKLYPMSNPGQIANLFRMLTVSKMTVPKQWTIRSSMLIEESSIMKSDIDQSTGLRVVGVVRRQNLDPYRPVLISGLGTFQILRIDITPVSALGADGEMNDETQVQIPPRFVYNPDSAPKEDEVEPGMGDEEMWSNCSDVDSESEEKMDDAPERAAAKRRLPKGTSEYQADWLLNSDSEAEGEIINSEDELESDDESKIDQTGDDEEDEMDWEEEKKQLLVAKAARTEAEFPDWIDTPIDQPAKIRFQRYRGLQSFKKSDWDANENLPKEYSKIFQFQNFKHTAKMVTGDKAEDDGSGWIPIGQRITILLRPLDEATSAGLVDGIASCQPVALTSLLKHETRISVLNLQLNVTEILTNKEELIFQVGFHRFKAKPILSEISPGGKHKMLRYAQINSSCMATVFGPISFPPESVLAFRSSKSILTPVGSGSLFSIDPTRLIIKRVLLSGYPFKVQGQHAVVRFMFFNRDDIDWFKPIELRTRYGRRGHIKEPLGTHGHMKCLFDGQMKSQDTILMPLYKRVFPKSNYDPNVPLFFIFDQQYRN